MMRILVLPQLPAWSNCAICAEHDFFADSPTREVQSAKTSCTFSWPMCPRITSAPWFGRRRHGRFEKVAANNRPSIRSRGGSTGPQVRAAFALHWTTTKLLANTAHRSESRVAIGQLARFYSFSESASQTGTAWSPMAPHLSDWVRHTAWCTSWCYHNCLHGQTARFARSTTFSRIRRLARCSLPKRVAHFPGPCVLASRQPMVWPTAPWTI